MWGIAAGYCTARWAPLFEPVLLGLIVASLVWRWRGSSFALDLICLAILIVPLRAQMPLAIIPGVNVTNILLFAALAALFHPATPARRGVAVEWFVCAMLPMIGLGLWRYVEHGAFGIDFIRPMVDLALTFSLLSLCVRVAEAGTQRILYTMALLLSVYFILAVIDLYEHDWLEGRFNGPHNQSNQLGTFSGSMVVISAVASLYSRSWRTGALAALALLGCLLLLLASGSRGGLLAAAVGVSVVALARPARSALAGAFVIAVLALALSSGVFDHFVQRVTQTGGAMVGGIHPTLEPSARDRLILWDAGFRLFIESPIFGQGWQVFSLLSPQYTSVPVPVTDPHSIYVFTLANGGLIASAALLTVFIGIIGLSARAIVDASVLRRAIGWAALGLLAQQATSSIFGTYLNNITNSMLAIMFWALVAATPRAPWQPGGVEAQARQDQAHQHARNRVRKRLLGGR